MAFVSLASPAAMAAMRGIMLLMLPVALGMGVASVAHATVDAFNIGRVRKPGVPRGR